MSDFRNEHFLTRAFLDDSLRDFMSITEKELPPSAEPVEAFPPTLHFGSTLFFFLFFGLMLFEAGRLFWPFIGSIGSAIVLAVVFRPLYDFLGRKFPRRSDTMRALAMDLLIAFLFVIPVAILIWSAASEALDLYPIVMQKATHANGWFHQSPTVSFPWLRKLPASLTSQLDLRSEQMKERLEEAGQQAFSLVAGIGTLVARRLLDVILDVAIMVFSLFFMFRDGETMYGQFIAMIPLSRRSKNRLSQTMRRTTVNVVRGNLLMSLAQTVMMTIGLLVVRSEAIVLLSFLTFATTFIPTVGTALVSVPAALYFFFAITHWKGIFLFIWGTLGMAVLDNVLRPIFVGGDEEMSFFWLLFAILGGLETFGIKGLLLGPLILSLMPVLFEIYRERYLDVPNDEV